MLFLSHRYVVAPWLKLGLNASLGGVARYGFGALAEGSWTVSRFKLRLFVSADNLSGVVGTEPSQGLQLQSGLSLLW